MLIIALPLHTEGSSTEYVHLRAGIDTALHSVGSRYFEVRGRLRWGATVLEERSLVERNGVDVRVLWSDRGQLAAPEREPLGRPFVQ